MYTFSRIQGQMSNISQTVNAVGVIVGRDLVGDALMKLPFLRALKNAYPKAEIHWITSQGATAFGGPLKEATKLLITQVHEQPQWLATKDNPSENVSAPHFDLLIDTRNRWRETLYARRIPHNLFLANAARYLFSERRPPLLRPRPVHLCDRLLEMVELAAGYPPIATGSLTVNEGLMQSAQKILPPGACYVGLAPGAGNVRKIWPRYKFEKVAALQVAKGRVPVFILGPQEMSAYDALAAALPTAKFPLQEYEAWESAQLTIGQTLAVARLLNVAVANDSGAGHMLAAVDCPLISLFGPTSPAKLAPRVSRSQIIRAAEFGSNEMKAITWEAVDLAIDKMLA